MALDIASNDRTTPLYIAIVKGHADIVHTLIAAGADVNKSNARGRTPLDAAIHYSRDSIIKALIEAGATTGPEAGDWSDEENE